MEEIFMSKFTNPLNNIKVASPCSADWNEMMGNERRRFCAECKLNVYNLSGMSQREAENLLLNSEGRLCVRFYKRTDGTILTKDCPVGWQAIRQRVSKTVTAFASLVFAALSGIGFANYFAKPNLQQATKTINQFSDNSNSGGIGNENSNTQIVGKPIAAMGGNIYFQNDRENSLSNGAMSNLETVRTQIKQQRKR